MLENNQSPNGRLNDDLLKQVEMMLHSKQSHYLDCDLFEEVIDFHLDENKLEKAERIIHVALEIHPDTCSLFLRKAQLKSMLHEDDEAKTFLEKAEDLEPSNGDIHLAKGMLFSKSGNTPEAISSYKKAISNLEFPEDAFPYLAFEYRNQGEYENALLYLEKYMDLIPDDEMSINLYFVCCEISSAYDRGIKFMQSLTDDAPYCSNVWFHLGLLYKYKKDYKQAYIAFEYAQLIDDEFIAAFHEMAFIMMELKKYKKAVDILEQVAKLEDPYAYTYLQLAKCYRELSNDKNWMKFSALAKKEDPQMDEAWFELGKSFLKLNSYEEALAAFEKAIELDSENLDYTLNICQIHIRNKEWNKAFELMSVLESKGQVSISFYKLFLSVLSKLEKFELGVEMGEKALKLFVKPNHILYFLTYLCFMSNQNDKAISYFEKVYFESPELLSKYSYLLKDFLLNEEIFQIINRKGKNEF